LAEKTGKQSLVFSFYSMALVLTITHNSAVQANVLEELLLFSASLEYSMSETLRIVLSKLKNTEARPVIHISYHFVLINVTGVS
jgi:hypothetical protein